MNRTRLPTGRTSGRVEIGLVFPKLGPSPRIEEPPATDPTFLDSLLEVASQGIEARRGQGRSPRGEPDVATHSGTRGVRLSRRLPRFAGRCPTMPQAGPDRVKRADRALVVRRVRRPFSCAASRFGDEYSIARAGLTSKGVAAGDGPESHEDHRHEKERAQRAREVGPRSVHSRPH